MIIKMYAIFARETLRQMQYEGKLAAQAGHCFLHAWWDADNRFGNTQRSAYDDNIFDGSFEPNYGDIMDMYRYGDDARKITLVVDTVEELKQIYEWARPHMGATLVEDCGYTVFNQPTITGVGLGPIPSDWTIGTILGDLKTYGNEIHV